MASTVFYLVTYAATNLATFIAVIAISHRIDSDEIADFAGMYRRSPGLSLGLASARYMETLLYEVKATDAGVLGLPALTILAAALLAAVPAVIHAVRIDPVTMLRSE